MALNTTVIKELRRELDCLKTDRMTIDAKIDALKRILGGTEVSSPASRKSGRRDAGARPSLRASILRALSQVPKATPAELTRQLEEDGFKVGGATTLRERVWHELSRLRRRGSVRRTRSGYYQVSQAKQSAKFAESTSGNPGLEIRAVN